MLVAKTQCPACCHGQDFTLLERFGRFSVLRCPDCTLEFSGPLEYDPRDYDRAYAAGAEEFYVPNTAWLEQAQPGMPESRWMLFAAQAEALRWLRLRLPGASLLDIGCGSGWFMARARQLGFPVMGVEIGAAPVQLLRQRGFEVGCGSLEVVPSNWCPEVVTLFEVLENLPDPAGFTAQIRQRFPGASFIVSVPSPKRWTKAGTHRDPADYPPNHLTRWNRDSLERMLAAAGYTSVRVSFPMPSALEAASVSIRTLAKSWFGQMPDTLSEAPGEGHLRPLRREIAVRKLKYLPAAGLSLVFRLAGWSGISMLAVAEP